MGASSSGLLDEAKISNIKGRVDSTLQNFRVFYCQQYSAAYIGHLHQEVEPKKEGRGLLLTPGPQCAPEEVLYQQSVKFSCWDEQGKKCRERYIILRRNYKVEIHENTETFSRGCAAKLVLQTAGGSVFTTEEESRAHLEQTCAGILNGVKEDSSSVVSSPDVLAVYLHLPYMGHTCFLFQQEEERDNFLSALKTCIRHGNLDPWCDSSYESQAYIRALRLYRQDKGCYESWEMLLGTEEQVLACQVMEEVLPWLQSQLQSRVKGKKTERIRQWLATVQATYTLVLEQLTASLETLREECRQTASSNQALIRSNLDQIISSHCFLEEKVRACICEEAEKVCCESVAPYMSSILEALTENISAGIHGMQHMLHTQMNSAFTHTNGGTEETKKALSTLRSVSLDQCYRQVENLTEKLKDLKQRFGLSSTQRLVHSAHLEMEKLFDSAVYTLELFTQSSARLEPSQIPVKMERAKERVLKQLDYDSRVVQRRLYKEALLGITLPALTRKMDSKWKSELQQFEQYIFSDYSSFILVHNVYDDVLRNILSKEIETVVQDAASKKSNNLLLDTSDLAISQYSLLGQTPPRSAQGSPTLAARDSSTAAANEGKEPASVVEEESQTVSESDPDLNSDAKPDPSMTQSCDQSTVPLSPMIVVTQQLDESTTEEASCIEETHDVQLATSTPSTTESIPAQPSNSAPPDSEAAVTHEVGTPNPDSTNPSPDSPDPPMSTVSSPQSTDAPAECAQSDPPATPESSVTPDLLTSDTATEDSSLVQHPCPSSPHPPGTDNAVKISLGSLCQAISCDSAAPSVMPTMEQRTTDRAVYLRGEIKDNWEVEKVRKEKQIEAAEETEVHERSKEGEEETQIGDGKEEDTEEERGEGKMEGVAQSRAEPVDEGCQSSEPPAESTTAFTTEQKEDKEKVDDEEKDRKLETEKIKGEEVEKEGKKEKEEEEVPQPSELQPESATELPLDSVAMIRELVTEITEVETVISPCANSSHTP
ncbi:protein Niban 1-like isoform X1 [Epinephelus moara]|uniref:protein Niban 1-like isoform X1 n=1 Tax=Epinephelus moara TaxID=300413 RepID=UPI00214F50D1|nr:protein Niban 1-like isoform X1 [Epinephelus moara]